MGNDKCYKNVCIFMMIFGYIIFIITSLVLIFCSPIIKFIPRNLNHINNLLILLCADFLFTIISMIGYQSIVRLERDNEITFLEIMKDFEKTNSPTRNKKSKSSITSQASKN